jgi:hypothetical protein
MTFVYDKAAVSENLSSPKMKHSPRALKHRVLSMPLLDVPRLVEP